MGLARRVPIGGGEVRRLAPDLASAGEGAIGPGGPLGQADCPTVDVDAELVAPCSPEELFTWVDDLARYPDWLEIVTRAEPTGDGAWAVDLRGRLGPLARSKRLRMIRAEPVGPDRDGDSGFPVRTAVFERAELDGRQHSPWRLQAAVAPHPDGSKLAMSLHYGGSLFGPVLERVLRDEIERSRLRLLDLVSTER